MWKRSYKKVAVCKFNGHFANETNKVRQPSLVDEFYEQRGISPDDGEESVAVCNPLFMLMNQQRLDRMGAGAITQWIDQLNQGQSSPTSQALQKVDKDTLVKMVKSRHIQHPSEMHTWLQALNARMDMFNDEVQRVLSAESAQVNTDAENIVESQIK